MGHRSPRYQPARQALFLQIFLLQHVLRAVLHFQVRLRQVLAQDADAQQLHAAQEQDDTDHGRPARYRVTEHERPDEHEQQRDKADSADRHAREAGDGQRGGRKGRDAVDGIQEQLAEAPLRLASDAFAVDVFQPPGLEPDPGKDALGEAVVFAQGQDGVDHAAGHQAVVAGAVHDLGLGDPVDEPVEAPREKAADGRFSLAVRAAGADAVDGVVRRGLLEDAQHVGKHVGRVLQIRVHDRDVVAFGVLQPRVHGGFLAEIARKADVAAAPVLFVQVSQHAQRAVFGAVVDEHEIDVRALRAQRFQHGKHGFVIQGQRLFFVVAGHDDADVLHLHSLDHVLHPLVTAVADVKDNGFDDALGLAQQRHQVDGQLQDERAEEGQRHADDPHGRHLADRREAGVSAAAHGAADLERVVVLQRLHERGDQQDAVRPQLRLVRERKQADERRTAQIHERRHEHGEPQPHVQQFSRQRFRVVVITLAQLFAQQHQGRRGRREAGHQEEVRDGARRFIGRKRGHSHAAVRRVLRRDAGAPEGLVRCGRGRVLQHADHKAAVEREEFFKFSRQDVVPAEDEIRCRQQLHEAADDRRESRASHFHAGHAQLPEDEPVVEHRVRKERDDRDVQGDLRLLGGTERRYQGLRRRNEQEVDRRDAQVSGAYDLGGEVVREQGQHALRREQARAEKQQAGRQAERPGHADDLADIRKILRAPELAVERAAARAEAEDHHPVHVEHLGGKARAGQRQFAQFAHHDGVHEEKRAGDEVLQRDGDSDRQKRPVKMPVVDVDAVFHEDNYIKEGYTEQPITGTGA